TIFSYAAVNNLELDHLDVDTAFLNPTLKEQNYLRISEYFHLLKPWIRGVKNQHYLKLNKAIYGLKQSPREWFLEVKHFFREIEFGQSEADPNLFISSPMGENRERIYMLLLIYILLFFDDMLVCGRRALINNVKLKIISRWSCKNLGPIETFVGFQVKRDRANHRFTIHQEMYVKKLIERLGMSRCNGVATPLIPGLVLKEYEDDEFLNDDNAALYRLIVGSTIYLSNSTRPDIAYAVGQLARFMAKPRISLNHAKHLLRYLQCTGKYGITYSVSNKNSCTSHPLFNAFNIYADATWATENERKSFQGYAVVYNGGAISWAAQRQKTTSLSSMEAEIIAANEGAKEAAWMEKLWLDLHQKRYVPTLWCDNEAAKEFCKDSGKFHNKAKHIETRYFFVRNDMVAKDRLKIEKIAGSENPADILTKQLPHHKLGGHLQSLCVGKYEN
ncbi:hypothetical protein K3495_g14771, partial [Podosphaera aphanis]